MLHIKAFSLSYHLMYSQNLQVHSVLVLSIFLFVLFSQSQESPVWSDPGSCRLPLRFFASHAEPINTVLTGGCSSIPLISEPEEVPEDSFDLMRHLRLNKPQHVTKGMFLEPVTEELEVSSVGSGTIRTKISRKLSNEGTIVREESLEQGNLESEMLLNVPVTGSEQTRFDLNEAKEMTVVEKVEDESKIVVNLPAEAGNSVSHSKGAVPDYEVKSSSVVVNSSIHSIERHPCESSTSSEECISKDFTTNVHVEEEGTYVIPGSAVPAHLKVASVVVQDSFELEEIGNDDYNEKESSISTDQEAGLIVKALEKRLTRENSGESSGFEEMLPDKETGSPNSSSPILSTKMFSSIAPVLVSHRRPLEALLDPGILSLAAEEKSPRATFAQRRTKSLTKQRPIDEDTFASWAFSARSSAAKYVAENVGTSVNHEDSTITTGFEDTGSNFLVDSTQEPVIGNIKSSLDSYVGETDENCNKTSKFEPKNLPVSVEPYELEESDISLGKQGTALLETFETEMQTKGDLLSLQDNTGSTIEQSEVSSRPQSEIILGREENVLHSRLPKEEFISQQDVSENTAFVSKKTDPSFPAQGDGTNTYIEQGAQSSRELMAHGKLFVTSLSEENGAVGTCAEVRQREESQKALRKVDSEYQQVSLK